MPEVKESTRRLGWAALSVWSAWALRGALLAFMHALTEFLQHPVWGPLQATADAVFIVFSLIVVNIAIRFSIHPTRDANE